MSKLVYIIQRQMTTVAITSLQGINNSWTDFKINRKIFVDKKEACKAAVREAKETLATYSIYIPIEDEATIDVERFERDGGVAFTGEGKDGDLYVVMIKILTGHLINSMTVSFTGEDQAT